MSNPSLSILVGVAQRVIVQPVQPVQTIQLALTAQLVQPVQPVLTGLTPPQESISARLSPARFLIQSVKRTAPEYHTLTLLTPTTTEAPTTKFSIIFEITCTAFCAIQSTSFQKLPFAASALPRP